MVMPNLIFNLHKVCNSITAYVLDFRVGRCSHNCWTLEGEEGIDNVVFETLNKK